MNKSGVLYVAISRVPDLMQCRLVGIGSRQVFERKLRQDAKVVLMLVALGEEVPLNTVEAAVVDVRQNEAGWRSD